MGDLVGQINSITETMDSVLETARNMGVPVEKLIPVPLSKLPSRGDGVSSLVSEFNKVTQTATETKKAFYQLANSDVGDTLKMVKNGNFWDAFKTSDGGAKLAQLKSKDPLSGASSIAMKANPATMMMAVALFSIEKELGDIKDMQKQILDFLEAEKQSEIKTDVNLLTDIIYKYKFSWDDERFINSRLNTVEAINRTARKNMDLYRTQAETALNTKKFIVVGNKVNSDLTGMLKTFKNYRTSLYTFSLSSFADIMLRGNFKEVTIQTAISEISGASDQYRALFAQCSEYLENRSKGSVQTNFLKGAGAATNAMGKMIGSIPKVKDKQANGFFIEKGEKLKDSAQKGSVEVVESFAEMGNPNNAGILRQLEDMKQIYNKTTGICFDQDNLYLVAE